MIICVYFLILVSRMSSFILWTLPYQLGVSKLGLKSYLKQFRRMNLGATKFLFQDSLSKLARAIFPVFINFVFFPPPQIKPEKSGRIRETNVNLTLIYISRDSSRELHREKWKVTRIKKGRKRSMLQITVMKSNTLLVASEETRKGL